MRIVTNGPHTPDKMVSFQQVRRRIQFKFSNLRLFSGQPARAQVTVSQENMPGPKSPVPEKPNMPNFSMGPAGNEWTYTPCTRTYDLTRGEAQAAFTMRTSRGAADISIAIAPEHSALVVIDMQNYFLHSYCNIFPSGLAAAENTVHVVKACRRAGIKVSIIRLSYKLLK